MKYRHFVASFSLLMSLHFFNVVSAQPGLCPPNIDFETGDFTNWQCYTGTVAEFGNQNIPMLVPDAPTYNKHMIIAANDSSLDYYGGFPKTFPNGGNSVQLGNAIGGGQAEGISYTYDVPGSVTSFSITYQYAIVFQNPDHGYNQQPRFRVNVINVTDDKPIDCVTFDFTASSSLPGFKVSPMDSSVLYKEWASVTIDLSEHAGKTIKIEFITSDCTFQRHFGYAYVDVSSSCSKALVGDIICEGDKSATLTAPHGFQAYEWFTDITFSQLLSSSQILQFNPPPAVGTIYPVIVTPFFNYGCKDTFYAKIAIEPRPIAIAGADISICKYEQVQIGTTNTTGHSYAWTPSKYLSDPASSNPVTRSITAANQELVVKMTNLISGCFSYDTILAVTRPVDTSLTLLGKNVYCIGDQIAASLSVNNVLSSVQWYRGNTPISGATSFSYLPFSDGKYWARVMQNGCTDSTRTIPIDVYLACNYIPTAFTPNGDGLNDIIKPFLTGGNKSLKNFSIYNRWGNLVFYSEKNGEGWDGTYKGKKQDEGLYIWILNLQDPDGKTEQQKGTVTLIR